MRILTIEAEGPREKISLVTQIARFSFICKVFGVFLSFLGSALFSCVLHRFLEGVTGFATQMCVTPFFCFILND